MKKTEKSSYGTSFFMETIEATPEQLTKLFGEPSYDDNTGREKVNLRWDLEDEDENIITIYDWKEDRKLYSWNIIEWHIGGNNKFNTIKAKIKLKELLNQN